MLQVQLLESLFVTVTLKKTSTNPSLSAGTFKMLPPPTVTWDKSTNLPLNLYVLLLLSAGVTGLYFSQNEYIETVYVGQPAGTPVLQVHAMRDSDTERPHFYLCWMNSLRRPAPVSWFRLDISTGVLSLNKTLEESDFASLCECYTSRGTQCHTFYSHILFKLQHFQSSV